MKIKIEIEGEKPRVVSKIPSGYTKKPVVPFNWGYILREGKVVGKYQYLK